MKYLLLTLLALTACRATTITPPTPEELQASAGERATAFMVAMTGADMEGLCELASTDARPLFEAELALRELLLQQSTPRTRSEVELRSVTVEEAQAVASMGITTIYEPEGGEAAEALSEMEVHLVLEDGTWGAFAIRPEDSPELMRFIDRLPEVEQRLARAREEATPHPELGPLVEAYLAAAAKKDEAGMTANMTAECVAAEAAREHSFTSGFRTGTYRVSKWQFDRHELDGGTAMQRVRTLLVYLTDEVDPEPMRFQFVRVEGAWKLAAIE